VKVTLKQALLGTLIVIPFLDSTKPSYQLRTYQDILTPQTEKRFLNEGLPYPKDPTKRGDLIVKFDILFPKLLLSEQRTIADCFLSDSMDFYQPYDSVLHKTIIDQTQLQQSTSILTSTSSLKSQPSHNSNTNNNNNNPKLPHRHINNNGRQNSPAPTLNNTNQTKATPVRIPPPVPPRPSPNLLAETHTNESVF